MAEGADISEDELVEEAEGQDAKPSATRPKKKDVPADIDLAVNDAVNRVFGIEESGGANVDAGWITLDEITAQTAPEPTAYNGTKTPLRPPPVGLVDDSKRGDSEEPPGLPILQKTPIVPSPTAVGKSRKQMMVDALQEKTLAEARVREQARLAFLLEEYVSDTPPRIAPRHSEIRQKVESSVDKDLLELKRIAHGNNSALDTIDFQITFRQLLEQYSVESLYTYLINFLRLQQPLKILYLGDDSDNWHVSVKNNIETFGPDAPPKVLLFKVDFSDGKKIRHQLVELVYILQGL